jgi:hypothetical protein
MNMHNPNGWCQPRDYEQRMWILKFEDDINPDQIFTDEQIARKAYEIANVRWTCFLFCVAEYKKLWRCACGFYGTEDKLMKVPHTMSKCCPRCYSTGGLI